VFFEVRSTNQLWIQESKYPIDLIRLKPMGCGHVQDALGEDRVGFCGSGGQACLE
jgi:hypothetical protein